MFNYRGEQTHFKGKRTQGEYVSIRENGHHTVLTWEQFDWKSGGGKEDFKKKIIFICDVSTHSYYFIYNTARRFNSIFMYNFSKQTYGLHFYFQHALVWLFIFISKKNQIFIFKILLVSPRYQMVVTLSLLSDRRGA